VLTSELEEAGINVLLGLGPLINFCFDQYLGTRRDENNDKTPPLPEAGG